MNGNRITMYKCELGERELALIIDALDLLRNEVKSNNHDEVLKLRNEIFNVYNT